MEETVAEFYFSEASIYLDPYLDLIYVKEIFLLDYCTINRFEGIFWEFNWFGHTKNSIIS